MAEIETDIEFEDPAEVADGEEELDPVVLAYRVGDHRRFVRLKRSEVRADPGLVEVSKTAQSFDYDPIESLNREPEPVRPAEMRRAAPRLNKRATAPRRPLLNP